MTQSFPDTTERVPIEEALKFGWDGMKKHFWLLLGMMITAGAPYMICHVIIYLAGDKNPLIVLVMSLIGLITLLIGSVGLIRVACKIVSQESIAFADMFSVMPRVFSYLGATILFVIAFYIGLFLLVVPGVIIAIKLQFYPYFIADRNMGPIAALKASWAVTKDVKLRLFLLYLVFGVVNTVGMLALIIGLLPAAMVVMIAQAFVYRRLAETTPETADIPSAVLV
jgi:uncharacterized membrane protein